MELTGAAYFLNLITSYLSGAFVAGMAAIMPVLLALGSNRAELVGGVSGALGFLFVETHL